jgi:chromosome partitioning protein
MKTVVIANQKGGVGKTATAHTLGVVLAGAGLRVLLVDCDPQSSLTQAAGVRDVAGNSLAEVLGGSQPGRLPMGGAVRTVAPGLDLVPGDIALAGAELGLTSRLGRELVLRKALSTLGSAYDLALLDCPPSLGLLTVAALVAADAVLIPTQPQAVDLRGLRLFLETLETIKAELNPSLETLGILMTFYDARLNHHRQALEALQTADLPVLPVMIGRSVRVAEAAGLGQSVITYEPHNPQADNYRQLAEVIRAWLKSNRI